MNAPITPSKGQGRLWRLWVAFWFVVIAAVWLVLFFEAGSLYVALAV